MIHDGSSPFDKAQGPEHSRGTKSPGKRVPREAYLVSRRQRSDTFLPSRASRFTLHDRRFTPKSSGSAITAEALMNHAGLRPQIPAAQHSHRVHLGMLYDDILRRLSNLPGSDLRSHNDQRRDNLAQRLAAP